MASIGIPLTWRRLVEPDAETPWTEEEAAAPVVVVIGSVLAALVLIAVAAFV